MHHAHMAILPTHICGISYKLVDAINCTQDVGDWASAYIIHRIHDFNPTAERPFVLGLPTGHIMPSDHS